MHAYDDSANELNENKWAKSFQIRTFGELKVIYTSPISTAFTWRARTFSVYVVHIFIANHI